jgi:hypothetical protein
MPSGEQQAPGGWNRIHLTVDDLDAAIAKLKAAGGHFRNKRWFKVWVASKFYWKTHLAI